MTTSTGEQMRAGSFTQGTQIRSVVIWFIVQRGGSGFGSGGLASPSLPVLLSNSFEAMLMLSSVWMRGETGTIYSYPHSGYPEIASLQIAAGWGVFCVLQ